MIKLHRSADWHVLWLRLSIASQSFVNYAPVHFAESRDAPFVLSRMKIKAFLRRGRLESKANEVRCNSVTSRSYQFTICGYREALQHGNKISGNIFLFAVALKEKLVEDAIEYHLWTFIDSARQAPHNLLFFDYATVVNVISLLDHFHVWHAFRMRFFSWKGKIDPEISITTLTFSYSSAAKAIFCKNFTMETHKKAIENDE